MKTTIICFFLAAFFVTHTVLAQDCTYYEYKVSAVQKDAGISGFLKCFNQGGNSRVESVIRIPEMPKSLTRTTSLSTNENPNNIFLLIPEGKMYSEVSFATFSEAGRPKEEYDINFLANEIVNGYNCIHIVSKYASGQLKYEMWISKNVPGFAHYLISRANKFFNDEEFFKYVTGKGIEGIPVRIKTIEMGKEIIFDLVTAEKTEAESSFFSVPSNYTATTSSKLSTLENVMEDMQNMSPEEAKLFLQQMKKKYGVE